MREAEQYGKGPMKIVQRMSGDFAPTNSPGAGYGVRNGGNPQRWSLDGFPQIGYRGLTVIDSDDRFPEFPDPQPRVPPAPDTTLPDRESDWITAAQAGDRSAFARLVDSYWERLYRWLYQLTRDRHRAEDLAQETFLKALAAIGSFRPGSNFRAWLFRIGHNNFVNLKRGERRNVSALTEETARTDGESDPVQAAGDREQLARVNAAVAALPADFRAALLLRAEQGMSFKEVAAVLKITEETARWRVFKARQKLMNVLEPEESTSRDEEVS